MFLTSALLVAGAGAKIVGRVAAEGPISLGGTTRMKVSSSDLLQTSLASVRQRSEDLGPEREMYNGRFQLGVGTDQRLTVGANDFIEFSLDLTTNHRGYDLTSMTTSSHWEGTLGGRSDQRFRLLISFVDAPRTFVELAPKTHYTVGHVGGRTVQVTLENDSGGVLSNGAVAATGVAAVRIEFDDNRGAVERNGAPGGNMYREIDIVGTPTPIVRLPLRLSSVVMLPGNELELTISSEAGTFLLEATPNLRDWIDVTRFSKEAGDHRIRMPVLRARRAYFRVRTLDDDS